MEGGWGARLPPFNNKSSSLSILRSLHFVTGEEGKEWRVRTSKKMKLSEWGNRGGAPPPVQKYGCAAFSFRQVFLSCSCILAKDVV